MKQTLRRWCVGAMTAVLTVTSLPVAAVANTVVDKTGGGDHTVSVAQNDGAKTLTIGNDLISRTLTWEDGKLVTTEIDNKRANTKLTPGENSEEFVFRTTETSSATPAGPAALERTGWTVTASSQETSGENGKASNLIDGDVNTYWHSQYNGKKPTYSDGHWFQVALGGETTFQCFSYTPRQAGESVNGNIGGYKLLYSNAETAPTSDADWQTAAEGTFEYNGVSTIYVNLENAVTARFVKLVGTSAHNGAVFAGGAEFNLHADKAPEVKNDREFTSSDLTVANVSSKDVTTTFNKGMVNERQQSGKQVTFEFSPIELKGVAYTIKESLVMYHGDHYLRKFLEISVPKAQEEQAAIDYIDLESLDMTNANGQWTIPTDKGGIVEMDEFKANLGQPIYAEGMFFGCEFPETDTHIDKSIGYMRYYSGKTFKQLVTDSQAGESDGNVVYNTWQTVAGAARSIDTAVVQSDFYDYITDIATPSEFRTQYNSWFDNMMLIDDNNILESFKEVNKQLEAAGAEPLDSYVVDDGWNNYNNTGVVDASRSGTTLNKTGFWEFNSKFPEGLTPSSTLVKKLGSEFGVWVGPRGGYNFYQSLADILVKSNKGSKAGGSIDVADREYVKNFAEMSVEWQRDYGVNYWKWDGFADRKQYNQWSENDGTPGYANRHMTGGFKHMYHVTDLWEAWIDLFEQVRKSEVNDNITNLWISLTCYVNPSPWFLQWANSVWIQCTHDQNDAGNSDSKMDRQLTYRDACYYDFIKNHEFQFPLANLYNHDPIYGVEGTGMNKNTATDVQFANYLYTQASRGTAFWELYFSESIMTEGKWQVTAKFLEWAKENNHILRNAKMFGQSPNTGTKLGGSSNGTQNTYGYSGFDGEEGLVMLRNSSTSAKGIEYAFDATNGVAIDSGDYDVVVERVYNPSDTSEAKDTASDPTVASTKKFTYGQKYTFNLQPDESITLRVTKKKDAIAPKITSVTTDGAKTVTVKFDEFVKLDDAKSVTVKGAEVESVEASADRVTFDIKLAKAPKNGEKLAVSLGVTDVAGNSATCEGTVVFRKGNKIASKTAELDGKTAKLGTSAKSVSGTNDFGVDLTVTGATAGTILASQPGAYTVGVNGDGHPYVTVGDLTATADVAVDKNEHAIVAERTANGMIKIYVDGALAGSVYGAELADLASGQATIGSEQFHGTITATVYDTARGYDVIADELNPSEPVEPDGKIDASEMKATVIGGTSEGDVKNIFDGNDTTFWTSGQANAIAKGSPAVKVDLGSNRDITKVSYTKRYYNSPANQWKCTGNARQLYIEYSNDGENWTTMLDVDTSSDEALDSKGNGGTWSTDLQAPVKARYIRVSGGSSYHWQSGSENKFFTIGDLSIYEVPTPDPVDKDELNELIAKAKEIKTDGKTGESVAAFEAAIEAAKTVAAKDDATQNDVDAAVSALEEAIDGLEDVAADKSELKAAIAAAMAVKTTGFTPSSVEAFEAARDEAVAKAQKVLDDDAATQEQVNAAVETLNKDIADAKELLKDALHPKPGIDKTELHEAIYNGANVSVPEGYTDESVAEYFKLIEKLRKAAEEVMGNEDATQAEIDAATKALLDGIEGAKSVLVKADSGASKKDEKPETKPETKPAAKPADAKKKLPQSGDNAVMYVAATAAAGAIALGAAVVLRRRRS